MRKSKRNEENEKLTTFYFYFFTIKLSQLFHWEVLHFKENSYPMLCVLVLGHNKTCQEYQFVFTKYNTVTLKLHVCCVIHKLGF